MIRSQLTLPCPELYHLKLHREPFITLRVEGHETALHLIAHLPDLGLCLVGSRNPLDVSRKHVRSWAKQLAHSTYKPPILISGLARGIDGEVHESALASGLRTIAFVGHGLNHQYPAEHWDLRKRIVEAGGLIVSEYEDDLKPARGMFVQRNRLMAFFSHAVCVIEASRKSGSLWTTHYATLMNRERFAVPCAPDDPRFGGNQHLIDMEGAHLLWGVHSLGKLWTELVTVEPSIEATSRLSRKEQAVLGRIRQLSFDLGGVSTEALVENLQQKGETPREVFKQLVLLKEKSLIREVDGLWRTGQ